MKTNIYSLSQLKALSLQETSIFKNETTEDDDPTNSGPTDREIDNENPDEWDYPLTPNFRYLEDKKANDNKFTKPRSPSVQDIEEEFNNRIKEIGYIFPCLIFSSAVSYGILMLTCLSFLIKFKTDESIAKIEQIRLIRLICGLWIVLYFFGILGNIFEILG